MTRHHRDKTDSKMRFFDHDGFRHRAACICIRNEGEDQVNEINFKMNLISNKHMIIFFVSVFFHQDFIDNFAS